MKVKRYAWVLSACIAAGSALSLPATAGVVVDVNVAPPPDRVEVVPGPRAGYVWAPGFWDYRGQGHVWVPGRWRAERRGWRWEPDHWVQRGPGWHREPGHWVR